MLCLLDETTTESSGECTRLEGYVELRHEATREEGMKEARFFTCGQAGRMGAQRVTV